MAIVYMTKVNVPQGEDFESAWEYETAAVATAGNGDSVMCPDGVAGISATLEVTAGTGSIETTTSSYADVIAGTAVWVAWAAGTIAATAQNWVRPVTAFRMVNATGTTKMTARAQ